MAEKTSNPSIELGWQRALLILPPFLFVVAIFEFVGAMIINAPLLYYAEWSSTEKLVITTYGMFGTV